MGSVSDWLDFIPVGVGYIIICHNDGVCVYKSRAAARMFFGSSPVYGMKSYDSNLYLFLYPIELQDMNIVLNVSYNS